MNTLIVYDRKKNQGPAVIIGSIISMSAYAALNDEINDKAYGRLIVVADKDNFKETAKIRSRFAGKNIVLCPVQTEADEETAVVSNADERVMPLKDVSLTDDAVIVGEHLADEADATKMPPHEERFCEAVGQFLRTHDTGVLATGEENNLRATPIEYVIYDGAFYCFSEGGHKFSYIWKNKRASFAVNDPFKGLPTLAGVQAIGRVGVLLPGQEVYEKVCAIKGLSTQTIEKMPVVLHLIELRPDYLTFLWGPFIKEGLPVKQIYVGDMKKILK